MSIKKFEQFVNERYYKLHNFENIKDIDFENENFRKEFNENFRNIIKSLLKTDEMGFDDYYYIEFPEQFELEVEDDKNFKFICDKMQVSNDYWEEDEGYGRCFVHFRLYRKGSTQKICDLYNLTIDSKIKVFKFLQTKQNVKK